MTLCEIRSGLKLFLAFGIFLILQIEVDTSSRGILADEMEYEKVRYLVFWEFIANMIRCFNI